MTFRHFCRIAAVAALLADCAIANANVVTFDSLANDARSQYAGDGTTYSENGLTFTSDDPEGDELLVWGAASGFAADPTGATLAENSFGQYLTITKTGGGAFTLNSIDLADVFNTGLSSMDGGAVIVDYTWTDGTGTHSSSASLDDLPGLQTFEFGLSGVTSFALESADTFQMDNVTFDAISAVPEPGSLGLMAAGLLTVAGAVGRRRKA